MNYPQQAEGVSERGYENLSPRRHPRMYSSGVQFRSRLWWARSNHR